MEQYLWILANFLEVITRKRWEKDSMNEVKKEYKKRDNKIAMLITWEEQMDTPKHWESLVTW